MNIGIDIRPALKRQTGIGKYTLGLINALAGIDSANKYYLYSKKKLIDFRRRLPALPGSNFYHKVDYFKKGPGAALPAVDIFHTSSYDLERPGKAGYFITVHDVIIKAYPYGHSEKTIKEIDTMLKRAISEVDLLVSDSHSTKADLIRFYGVPDSKVVVIYPGVDVRDKGQGTSDKADGDYILFVGTLEPRKNVDGLIKAFNLLKKESGIKHKLYIVGMKGWMYENIFREYEKSEYKNDIIFKGYVDDSKFPELYGNASVFVYPSFYEGFGFPVVEAMGCGAPVVTSKTSSCGEVAGDAALTVEPSDYKEISRAIMQLIKDDDLRKNLIAKGINRAKDFTWEKAAREFVGLFTK